MKKPKLQSFVNPKKRKKDLPWQYPKSLKEDPKAHSQIEKILDSPGYIIAEKDTLFLQEHATLGIRLELDYQKAELLLQKHGVEHTIVVFGSARAVEHKTAMHKLELAQKALMKSPGSSKKMHALKLTEKVLDISQYYNIARQFGQLVGACGRGPTDSRITLMTGGGPGIMEAANRGAFDVGSKSIGLNISLPNEQFPNPYITPELCFKFHYFAIRKLHFLLRAKALVFFPGGFGTMDELFGVLTLIQTRKIDPIPIVLVGQEYWERLIDINFMEDESMITSEDRSLFWYAQSAEEIWEGLITWHETNKTPLF